jgi:hypothetical protein
MLASAPNLMCADGRVEPISISGLLIQSIKDNRERSEDLLRAQELLSANPDVRELLDILRRNNVL